MATNIIPEIKLINTATLLILYSNAELPFSYFMIPARIIPPKINFAKSIANLPVSASTVFSFSSFMANLLFKILYSNGIVKYIHAYPY